jgi:hypothetical protein
MGYRRSSFGITQENYFFSITINIMEKGDLSDTEQEVKIETPETVLLPKPKRKMTLTEEERKRRGDNLRTIVAKRKAQNDQINEEVKEDVKAVKTEASKKIKKIKKEKMLEVQYPELDSDSDSDDSDYKPLSSKKKRKSKQPIIIIKNYTGEGKKQHKEYDVTEQVTKLQEQFKQPELEPVRKMMGYFV